VTLDQDYSPSSLVQDVPALLGAYATRSAQARAELAYRTLRYGPDEAMALDYFPAPEPGAPLLAYVHGGYWQEMSRSDFSFPALGLVRGGGAYAALGYGLAPEHTLDDIVASVRRGLAWLADHARELGVAPDRIVVAGSSAGAHLVAMALLDGTPRFAGAVLASGVYDLEPIRHTYVNAALRLSAADAARNSPIRHLPRRLPPLLLVRGEHETGAFARQQARFARALTGRAESVREMVVPGRNHFDLTFDLTDPDRPLGRAVHRGLGLAPEA
jgi:arylformamidase